MKVTGTASTLISKYCDLTLEEMSNPENIHHFAFVSKENVDHFVSDGYSYVGAATITVEILPPDQLVGSKVDALRKEMEKVRADAVAKCTIIERQINNLLSIGFDPSSSMAPNKEDGIPF